VPGSNPFGKFGPIILLAVVQLVVVLAVPSTAPNANGTALGQSGYTNGVGANGQPLGTNGQPLGANGQPLGTNGQPVVGGVTQGGVTQGGTTTGSAGVGTSGGGQAVTASGAALQQLPGDRSHCVGGRQFSPAIDYYAPPCVPGSPGAAYANNGGSTWRGVTGGTIEIVNYVADYGAEVDQILKAQGLYYTADQAKSWNAAYADFINTRYNLWGRKIHVDSVEGKCRTVPPDYSCLIGEMDTIVAKYKPYAVFWETTVCSACFAELSRLHVVNFGGGGFSDKFHNANAPYSYDGGESATRIQLQFANWWCAQMAGKKAAFAGTQNAAENLRGMTRQLGVVSTNDPDNESTVKNVLYPALKKGCGQDVNGHEYFYAQDINTAAQQSATQASKMNTPTNPATSVVCFCDPVAPQFGLGAYKADNYWPESILADDQTMDFDSNGQTYSNSDHSGDTVACPNGGSCPYDSTVGLSSNDPQTRPADTAAVKIWNLQTKKKVLPVAAATLQIVWNDYSMLASLLQNAGPLLTPARMQAAAPELGARGGGATNMPLKGFHSSNWCWTQDVRVVYWNRAKTSPYNGKHGSYVQIEGSRFNMSFPSLTQPPAPAPEDRH
jgi:hypothetical protein